MIIEELTKLIEPGISTFGCVLIGLELEKSESKLLRVYVEKKLHNNIIPENINSDYQSKGGHGVNLEDCAKITQYLKHFIPTLEGYNLSEYSLEVSSPGVERKLFNLAQFEEQLGKEIRIKLRSPRDGRSKFNGILQQINHNNNQVWVKVGKQELCLDYNDIFSANLVYRWA